MFNWKLVPHVTEHSVAVSQPAQPPTTKVYWLIYLFCWLAYVIKYNSATIIDIANFRTWCLDVLYMPNEMIGFYSDEVLNCRIHVTLKLHITIPLMSSQSFIRCYNIPCLVKKQKTTNFRNNYILWQMTHETSHITQVMYANHYFTEPQTNPLWGPSTLTRITWSHKTILCIQVVKVTLTLRSNETNLRTHIEHANLYTINPRYWSRTLV